MNWPNNLAPVFLFQKPPKGSKINFPDFCFYLSIVVVAGRKKDMASHTKGSHILMRFRAERSHFVRATRAGGAFGEICVRKWILDEGPRQKKGPIRRNKYSSRERKEQKRIVGFFATIQSAIVFLRQTMDRRKKKAQELNWFKWTRDSQLSPGINLSLCLLWERSVAEQIPEQWATPGGRRRPASENAKPTNLRKSNCRTMAGD